MREEFCNTDMVIALRKHAIVRLATHHDRHCEERSNPFYLVMMPKVALFTSSNRGEMVFISPLLFWVFCRRLI